MRARRYETHSNNEELRNEIEDGYSHSVSFGATHIRIEIGQRARPAPPPAAADNKIADTKSAHNIKVSHDTVRHPACPMALECLIQFAALRIASALNARLR